LIQSDAILVGWILFILFGQTTVRKLRKKPETRNTLGLELAIGWDIFNVAGAMCRPQWLSERLRRSTLSFTAADGRPIYENTNWFDRMLGRTMFIMMMSAVVTALYNMMRQSGHDHPSLTGHWLLLALEDKGAGSRLDRRGR
jgi:hypothetical protein